MQNPPMLSFLTLFITWLNSFDIFDDKGGHNEGSEAGKDVKDGLAVDIGLQQLNLWLLCQLYI